jgi:hypothetical protein
MEGQSKGLPILGVLLALGLMASASIVSLAAFKVRALNDTLAVTGSARQRVTSDAVKWNSSFTRTVLFSDLKSGYAQMKSDEKEIVAFLRGKGLAEADITISPVFMSENYKSNEQAPREFSLRQSVEVRSADVAMLTALAKDLQPLIDKGILFSSDYLEYSYSKLPELRVSLLSDAVRDAQARAEKIAESTGRGVGSLRAASMGVVQVLPVGSTEVSDYGAYDTQSVEKEVMVTVKTTFSLR